MSFDTIPTIFKIKNGLCGENEKWGVYHSAAIAVSESDYVIGEVMRVVWSIHLASMTNMSGSQAES